MMKMNAIMQLLIQDNGGKWFYAFHLISNGLF